MADILIHRDPAIVQIDAKRVENLTDLEFELLCYLYEHRGQVCIKDELFENVYRQKYGQLQGGLTDESLQSLVYRLRTKIEADPRRPRYIRTVRGQGYKFVEPSSGFAHPLADVEPDGSSGRPDSFAQPLSSQYRLPYHDYVVNEYVGNRHQAYEKLLQSRGVVCMWGAPGIGKTWAAARLAIEWEAGDPRRQAFWFECRSGMGLYDLVYGIAGYLHAHGEPFLWQMLQRDPDWAQRPTTLVDHVVDRLDQGRYLLCLDNFDNVDQDDNVRLLFETAEKRLSRQSSKVLLVGRHPPTIPMLASRELPSLPPARVEELVLKLKVYQKDWLDQSVAHRFANRLLELVGANLALINVVAVEWFRSNTSLPEAESYLDGLDAGRVAEMILERQDPMHFGLLSLLTLLEEGASCDMLVDLVRASAEKPAARSGGPAATVRLAREVAYALDLLHEARLVYVAQGRYYLHELVREICYNWLAEQKELLLDLHRRIGDLFMKEYGRTGKEASFCLQSAQHFFKGEAYDRMLHLLRDHSFDLIAAGMAQPARALLEEAERELDEHRDCLAPRQWLWIYILKSDLDAWLGRLPAAMGAAEMGLEECRTGGGDWPYEKARLQARLGSILGKMHRLDQAIVQLNAGRRSIRRAIQKAESVEEKTRRRYVLLHILDSLGLAHYVTASYGEALACLEEVQKTAGAIGDTPRASFFAARAQVRLAQIYNDMGKSTEALEHAQVGLEAFARMKLQWGLAFARAELGRICFKQGAYEQARSSYEESLAVARELHDSEIMVNCHLVLGEIGLADSAGRRDLQGAADHLSAARRIMAGKPERERTQEEASAAVQLPPPLEGFFDACRLWIEGLERLQRGDAEGKGCLCQAREILNRFGFDDDAALLEREISR